MLEELWEKYQKVIIIIGSFSAVVFLVIFFVIKMQTKPDSDYKFNQSFSTSETAISDSSSASSSTSATNQSQSEEVLMVDIKGAVAKPGVYEFKSGMRVNNIVDLAGGFTKTADLKHINLAEEVKNQQVIYIPIKGEVKGPSLGLKDSATDSDASSSTASKNDVEASSLSKTSSEQVNLNTATKEMLLNLNGIGDKKAEQILQYREEHGSFKTIEELKEVQGIGDKIFESIKDSVVV